MLCARSILRSNNYRRLSNIATESVKNSQGKTYNLIKTNGKFEEFYKKLFLKCEWEEALEVMRRPLPLAFRFTSFSSSQSFLSSLFEKEFGALIHRVPWYEPFGHAIQIREYDRWSLKSNSKLQMHVNRERNLGHLYRQELVSMVPVHFLDIRPGHHVLDMCASPGSKTTQALEYLNGRGLVIANEIDLTRLDKLVFNLSRFSSCNSHLTLCEDGRYFPDIISHDSSSVLQYDRIICDVPCSGDGTIRKNPNVWLNWHPARGSSRNALQYAIAARGVQLLKPGGLMVYSSCAMNPIENEAVISRLLKEFEGDIEIMDPPMSPGLNYSRGLPIWEVYDRQMNVFRDYSMAVGNAQVSPNYFPPTQNWIQDELTKTMRFQPHHNDDGGFFVAYIRKKANASRDVTSHSPQCKRKIHPRAIKPDSLKELKKSLDHFGIDHKAISTFFTYGSEFRKIRSTSEELIRLCSQNPSLNMISLGNVVLKKELSSVSSTDFKFPSSLIYNPLRRHTSKGLMDISLLDFKRLIKNEFLETTPEFPQNGPIQFIVKDDHHNTLEKCYGYVGKFKMGLNIPSDLREHFRLKYDDVVEL